MNARIRRLRLNSVSAVESVSIERARLMTDFYRDHAGEYGSEALKRAHAFMYLLENKEICINEGELIVGERGPAPKATPTYPEICTHTLKDLDILSGREKVSFSVDEEARRLQGEEIIPFWKGLSMRDLIFERMTAEWKDAYRAGMFTEFQEQRAPGHTVLDDKLYRKGLGGLRRDIADSMAKLRGSGGGAGPRIEQLEAMDVAARALISYAARYADALGSLASSEKDPARRKELETMAAICRRVPERPPETFWEALQSYWFVHLGVICELNTWDSFNPGRLDQHLLPFYMQGLEDGTLTKERAKELLMAFWIKFNNQPAPPKVGVTAQESNTYTDFCLINLGGVTEEGDDAVNELTYLILDVIEDMRLLQPSSMVQVSEKNPDDYLMRALKIVGTGFGQPSLFNTEAIVGEMVRQGKDIVDARRGGASGCVETGAFGRECYILTGYFNLPKILEITLSDGVDPLTGRMTGVRTGDPRTLASFEDLFGAFRRQLRHFVDIKIRGNLEIERLWSEKLPAPFLSLLIDDCIEKGLDYNSGGARYNTSYIQGVGLGTISDSLAAIRYHVYDRGDISMDRLLEALAADFEGAEDIRDMLLYESPKYGNDDDYADSVMRSVFEEYFRAVDGRENWKGGHFRINMLPTTCHVYFGSMTGALPDGRRSGKPLSEGISPVQGADREGPTAVLRSAAGFDHLKTGGTLLNQKFTPDIFSGQESMGKVAGLVRSYFRMMGHHVQFNVVSAGTLRRAQACPEEYRDLIVRVAGYSDYFVDLSRELQDEIIQRTEHGKV